MSGPRQGNCLVCGAELTLHQRYRDGLCDDWRCRNTVLERAIAAHKSDAAEALSIADPGRYATFVVPLNDRPVRRLSLRRRRRFRAHLRRIIRAALNRDATAGDDTNAATDVFVAPEVADEPAATPASDAALLGRACAACRGTCCGDGGDHAFLDRDHMARMIDEHPERSADELVETYLSFLPEESFRNACVYQSETGCTLPRDMRARICNAYECFGLKSYRRRLEESGPANGFAVVREDNRIIRSVFFDERTSRVYHPSRKGSR